MSVAHHRHAGRRRRLRDRACRAVARRVRHARPRHRRAAARPAARLRRSRRRNRPHLRDIDQSMARAAVRARSRGRDAERDRHRRRPHRAPASWPRKTERTQRRGPGHGRRRSPNSRAQQTRLRCGAQDLLDGAAPVAVPVSAAADESPSPRHGNSSEHPDPGPGGPGLFADDRPAARGLATRLTVFPLRPDAPLDAGALLEAVADVWPEGGGKVSLNVVSETLLHDLLRRAPSSQPDGRGARLHGRRPGATPPRSRRCTQGGNTLLIKGRPLRELPREVLPCFTPLDHRPGGRAPHRRARPAPAA